MARTNNNIVSASQSGLSNRQEVNSAISNIMSGFGGHKFSNGQAINAVCRAIDIVTNDNISPADKKKASMFAAAVAANSFTAGEEMQRAIEQAQQRIEQTPEDDFDDDMFAGGMF